MTYNNNFHNISVLYDPNLFNLFKDYSIQDSKALWSSLEIAKNQYSFDYNIDITTIVSASSLAFKIFRTKYLKHSIQIPLPNEDDFIRNSYFGGAAYALMFTKRQV